MWCRVWNKPLGFIIQELKFLVLWDQVSSQPSLPLTLVCHFLILLLWNIQHSSLHLSDSRVSPRGAMDKDHSSWTLPYFPSGDLSEGEKKRPNKDGCWPQRERIRMKKRQGREQKGGTLSSFQSDVIHWFLSQRHKGRTSTSSNNCLLWRHIQSDREPHRLLFTDPH